MAGLGTGGARVAGGTGLAAAASEVVAVVCGMWDMTDSRSPGLD